MNKVYKITKKVIRGSVSLIFIVLMIMSMIGLYKTIDPFEVGYETNDAFGFQNYYIKTDSMAPDMPVGALAVGKLVNEKTVPAIGDVFAYLTNDGSTIIIHRIIDKVEGGYIFKGDNNNVADELVIREDQLQSKIQFAVPKLGILMATQADSPRGFLIKFVIPSLFIISLIYFWDIMWDKLDEIFDKDEEDDEDEESKETDSTQSVQ